MAVVLQPKVTVVKVTRPAPKVVVDRSVRQVVKVGVAGPAGGQGPEGPPGPEGPEGPPVENIDGGTFF